MHIHGVRHSFGPDEDRLHGTQSMSIEPHDPLSCTNYLAPDQLWLQLSDIEGLNKLYSSAPGKASRHVCAFTLKELEDSVSVNAAGDSTGFTP